MTHTNKEQHATSDSVRIGVLYSFGPHFKQALQELRRQYPAAHITAITPPEYPVARIEELVTDSQPWAPPPEAPRNMNDAVRLVRRVRAERYDIFVVLFDSVKLQLVAGLSGARECCCCGLDGRRRPLRVRPVATLVRGMARRIRGTWHYWRIWLHIHTTLIRPAHHRDESQDDDQ